MAFQFRHGDRPLDGYTVLRGIGRGGFGEVFYAVSDGGREVALKCVQQNSEIELRGVRHCMNLKSPHLVSIFDVRTGEGGLPFVIMEHVKGPSLRDVLRENPDGLGVEKAAFFVREIAKGLGYLHDQGIVHRDLKPENIFFEDGYVKIGDYGLSKFISVSRQSGHTISVGTVHYMAPEIGSGNYQRSIDVYALGVMFFELLTGQVPFNGDSMGEILMKHLSCEPDLESIPEALRPVLMKALAKKPEERYATAEDLAQDVLKSAGVEQAVDALDPSCFSSVGLHADEDGAQIEVSGPGGFLSPPNAPTIAVADAPRKVPPVQREVRQATAKTGATAAPAAMSHDRPPPQPAVSEKFSFWSAIRSTVAQMFGEGREAQKHVFLGIGAAVVLGVGIGICTDAASEMDGVPLSVAAIILSAAVPILFVERWAVPRWRLEKGFQRGLTHVAMGGPFYAPFCLAAESPGTVVSVTVALLLVDWSERANPRREDAVDIGQAIMAGIVGLIVAAIVHADMLIVDGAIAASISLVVNAMAPFAVSTRGKKLTKAQKRAKEAQQRVEDHAESVAAAAPEATEAARQNAAVFAKGALDQAAEKHRAAAAMQDDKRERGAGEITPSPEPAVDWAAASPAVASRETDPTQRLMRSEDRMLGGVCGGFAVRYGIDATLIRMLFFLTLVFSMGYAMFLYFAFWVFMPAPASRSVTPPSVRRPRETREVSSGARVFCQILGSVFGLGALACATTAIVGLSETRDPDYIVLLIVAGGLGVISSVSFWKGTLRQRVGFWRGTLQPLLVGAAFVTTVSCAVALANVHFPGHSDERIALIVVSVCSATVSLALGAHWLRWLRRRNHALPPRPPVSRAWVALGMLLMTLAAMTFVATTLVCMGLGPQELVHEFNGFFPGHPPHFEPLFATFLFFLPGLFALLLARRAGGKLHVLRGVIGWLVAATLCSLASIVLIEGAAASNSLLLSELPSNAENILALVLLAAVAVLCLVWPASRRSAA